MLQKNTRGWGAQGEVWGFLWHKERRLLVPKPPHSHMRKDRGLPTTFPSTADSVLRGSREQTATRNLI